MDIRLEFGKLMEEYGNDIVYVRRMLGLHCRCWNEKEHSGNPRCQLCFGTGYVVKIEVHRTRSRTNGASTSLSGIFQYNEPGVTLQPIYFFYMKHDSLPAEGDLILDVTWDGQRPNQLIMPYEVHFAEPERGAGGRIEYWRASVTSISHDFSTYYEGMTKRNIRRNNT